MVVVPVIRSEFVHRIGPGWCGSVPAAGSPDNQADVKILRLTTSDENAGHQEPGSSSADVSARVIEQATGEPVEMFTRSPWPAPGLPDLIDRWLDAYTPDIVLLKVNSFWFNYLSVPLLLERKLGPAGKYLNRAGVRAGELSWLNRTRAFQASRQALVRVVGGATYFTPDEVITSMQDCSRRILAREGVGLVIQGPESRMNHLLAPKAARAHERRRLKVHHGMRKFAEDVHVPFFGQDTLPTKAEIAATVGADQLHLNTAAARRTGEKQGEVIAALWRDLRG